MGVTEDDFSLKRETDNVKDSIDVVVQAAKDKVDKASTSVTFIKGQKHSSTDDPMYEHTGLQNSGQIIIYVV